MSRVYFHSPSGEAELRGSERAHLNFVAYGPAGAAWGLSRHTDLDWMAGVIGLIPEVPDGQYGANYLHTYLREAQAEHARNHELYKAWKPGMPGPYGESYDASRRLRSSLKTRLAGSLSDTVFVVAGRRLHAGDLALNTALAVGSDPIKLAAKIHGWCEAHAWVDGPDRAWLAEIIDEGLAVGVYRRGIWYADQPDTPRDKWSSQGWEEVQAHLRSRDDEPCVMSYSVCDQFPNRHTAAWEPPPMPDDWAPSWADTDEGLAEWERDYPTAEDKAARYLDGAGDGWYELPVDEQWRLAMAGLRADKPWAQLSPDTLDTTFGPAVTVYDLLATDRDERISAAFAGEQAA